MVRGSPARHDRASVAAEDPGKGFHSLTGALERRGGRGGLAQTAARSRRPRGALASRPRGGRRVVGEEQVATKEERRRLSES